MGRGSLSVSMPTKRNWTIKSGVRGRFCVVSRISIVIRRHILEFKLKNPEYLINGEIGDRKGIMSEKGITDAFKRGVEQGCRIIVLDLDKHMAGRLLHPNQIAKYISWRPDFSAEMIHTCYVVYRGLAVLQLSSA